MRGPGRKVSQTEVKQSTEQYNKKLNGKAFFFVISLSFKRVYKIKVALESLNNSLSLSRPL